MLFDWATWNCRCLQDVVYLLMVEWVLKARQNILPRFLLYMDMSDNTCAAENNNKVNGMEFPSLSNWNGQNVKSVSAGAWGGLGDDASGECRKWVQMTKNGKEKKWTRKRNIDKESQLEEPMKGCSWIGWSRNQYRCFSWSLAKGMARL